MDDDRIGFIWWSLTNITLWAILYGVLDSYSFYLWASDQSQTIINSVDNLAVMVGTGLIMYLLTTIYVLYEWEKYGPKLMAIIKGD